MSERLRSLLFAGGLCLVCSLLLTAASTGLQRYQLQNMKIEKQRNILRAAGLLSPDETLSAERIERLFEKKIRAFGASATGELIPSDRRTASDLPLHVWLEDREIRTYVIPVESRGLWGKIFGYLALERDGATVAGFTVFKHAETPGLGGEIEKDWFQKNWIGKKIVDKTGGLVSVKIARGATADGIPEEERVHYVDGISGATLTGRYLTAGIRETLESYEPVSIRFRAGRAEAPQ